jgi:hypothetical protein
MCDANFHMLLSLFNQADMIHQYLYQDELLLINYSVVFNVAREL